MKFIYCKVQNVYVNGVISNEKYKNILYKSEIHYGSVPEENYLTLTKNQIEEEYDKSFNDYKYRSKIGLNNVGLDKTLFKNKKRIICYNETTNYDGIPFILDKIDKVVIETNYEVKRLDDYALKDLFEKLPANEFLELIKDYYLY